MTVYLRDQKRHFAIICPNCNTSNKIRVMKTKIELKCYKCELEFKITSKIKFRKEESLPYFVNTKQS